MATKDPRIDAYIAKARPFARPILTKLRRLVHAACPTVVETIKWGHPSFEHEGMLCGMASFKTHCAFGFWKHGLVEKHLGAAAKPDEAMGSLGCLRSLEDLPPDAVLKRAVKAAAKLNEEGVKAPRVAATAKPKAVRVPADLAAALAKSAKARATFDAFPVGQRREYVEWITEAKRAETRARRLATSIEWLREGKRKNWKYEPKSSR